MSALPGWDLNVPLATLGTCRAVGTDEAGWRIQPRPQPGPGYLSGEPPHGITTVKGSPASVEVRALYRPPSGAVADGVLVATTTSGSDGAWILEDLDPALEFDVVFRRPDYNDMILSRVKPKAYPPLLTSGGLTLSPDGRTLISDLRLSRPGGYRTQIVTSPSSRAPAGIGFSVDSSGLVNVEGRSLESGDFSWILRFIDRWGRSVEHLTEVYGITAPEVGQVNLLRTATLQSVSAVSPFYDHRLAYLTDGIIAAASGSPTWVDTFATRTVDQFPGSNNGHGVELMFTRQVALAQFRVNCFGPASNINCKFAAEYLNAQSVWVQAGPAVPNDCPPGGFGIVNVNLDKVVATRWRFRITEWVVPSPAANFYMSELEAYEWS